MKSNILIFVLSLVCLCLAMPAAEKRQYGGYYAPPSYNYAPTYVNKPIYVPRPVAYDRPIYIDKPYAVYKPQPHVKLFNFILLLFQIFTLFLSFLAHFSASNRHCDCPVPHGASHSRSVSRI